MELIDSRKQQLDYVQLMHQYYKNVSAQDPRFKNIGVWFAAMGKMIGDLDPDADIIGNTFFMSKRCSGENSDKAMVWAMNVDTLQNMADNVAEGLTRLADMGVVHIVATYKHAAISRPLRQAFNKIKAPGDTIVIEKVSDGTRIMYMNLSGDSDV